MKDKAIVSSATLVVSLLAYWYAKAVQKDVAPYIMVGGFIGSVVGETIVGKSKK